MARSEVIEARKAAGGRQVSASFTKDEVALLERARAELGLSSNKAAIVAGLNALLAGAPTPEQALRVLARLVEQGG